MVRWIIAALLASTGPATAQETRTLPAGAKSPPATIAQLDWLAGTWRGEGLGAPASEVYSAPEGGQITGHFTQQAKGGGIAFYEIIQIVPRGDSLVYRLRHFNADLTGWEDAKGGTAEEFALVALTADAAYFDGLTLRRAGRDAMTATVRAHGKDGAMKELAFRYRRAPR